MFFGISQKEFEGLDPPIRIFLSLAHGFHNSVPIVRASSQDKEYHFQNWVMRRIQAAGLNHTGQGRHGYPDFVLDDHQSGYEVKGLAYPGRVADFDCNSQMPLAEHEGRTIYYIFGRYPLTKESEFLVHDIVMCSASFLNAEVENTNTNQSFRGAGSYGDILIRDRRMYVCSTPYALASGTAGQATLIIETGVAAIPELLKQVGEIRREETDELVIGYQFDLQKNALSSTKGNNPNAGTPHLFSAHKIKGYDSEPVKLNERNR